MGWGRKWGGEREGKWGGKGVRGEGKWGGGGRGSGEEVGCVGRGVGRVSGVGEGQWEGREGSGE